MTARQKDSGEKLLVEAAQKDTACFAELYDLYFERVYVYISLRVGNADAAEDVDSEFFHSALANLPKFEWRGAPFGGDRDAGVKDVMGNMWFLSTRRISEHSPADMPIVTPGFSSNDPVGLINFLKAAFGASEAFVHRTPDGALRHARLWIGNSMIMVGPARGEFQDIPSMFYMYVDDSEAVYRRAIEAGATSIYPVSENYGDRVGAVKDPFGHDWNIATNLKSKTP